MNGEPSPTDEEMEEESEFWLFLDPTALPSLKEIGEVMKKDYPQLPLASHADSFPEGIVNGRITSPGEDDVEEIDTAWMVERLDAKKFFGKMPGILKDLGNKTQMIRVTVPDHFSMGHACAMLLALLKLRDGILSIPAPEENDVYVFRKKEAMALLVEELDEFIVDTEE